MAELIDDVQRVRYRASWFRLGEFRCPADHPRWASVNVIGDRPIVVFPHRTVVIAQRGREPVVATANHVVFYDGGQEYRREQRDASGDECVFVALDEPSLGELVERADPSSSGRPFRFPFVSGPSPSHAYLLHRAVLAHLDTAAEPDPLLVEEAVTVTVDEALRAAFGLGAAGTPRRPRARARAARRALVDGAKELLAARGNGGFGLDALARELHCSRFHLARTFRAETGFSLHAYRNQLRLRAALERLSEDPADLSRLALELGYSSHSHFANTFRAGFGLPPSTVRRALGEPSGLHALLRR